METWLFIALQRIFANIAYLGSCCLLYSISSVSARAITHSEHQKNVEKCHYDNITDTLSCSTGHCCENNICCRRYFEHWWFWCIWVVIILLSCCCFYHHQKRKRTTDTTNANSRSEGIYSGACNYPGPPIDKDLLGYCKLPKYTEVIRIPPSGSPPPPYSERRIPRAIARISQTADNGLEFMQQSDLTSSMMSLFSNAFNFRGNTQFSSPTDSNQNFMDSISELAVGQDQNTVSLLEPPPLIQDNEMHKEVEALMTMQTSAVENEDHTVAKII